jgi:hypothetical protein
MQQSGAPEIPAISRFFFVTPAKGLRNNNPDPEQIDRWFRYVLQTTLVLYNQQQQDYDESCYW